VLTHNAERTKETWSEAWDFIIPPLYGIERVKFKGFSYSDRGTLTLHIYFHANTEKVPMSIRLLKGSKTVDQL
jgi:hypothetical protein